MSRVSVCRSCGTNGLRSVLDLGAQPLANGLVPAQQRHTPVPTHPLELALCLACGLAQLTEDVPPRDLFCEYAYFSSYSDSFVAHARVLVERLIVQRGLGAGSRVVEIASNDGYLLQHYVARGVPVLGIEPAANVAEAARARGIETRVAFFDRAMGAALAREGWAADVVHANNVLAHVPDLGGFVAGLAALLRPGGVAVIEVPHVRELLARLEFDTIYHEHLFYFSLLALEPLFARHGLTTLDVERLAVHGGSLRLFVGARGQERSAAVDELLALERAEGLDRFEAFADFALRVHAATSALRARLIELRASGLRLAGYGAAAKATVLLNTLSLPLGTLEFVADRSPHKQGRYIPGTDLLVRPVEALLEAQPDLVVLFAWNLKDEVLAQQAELRQRGTRFLIPLPQVELL